jgi:hypothetical protein
LNKSSGLAPALDADVTKFMTNVDVNWVTLYHFA